MTESEAKTILERDLNCLKQNKALPDSIESMEIAIKALEKQIPKKPVLKHDISVMHINRGDQPHEWKRLESDNWHCPECNSFVGERVYVRDRHHDQRKKKYCDNCGNKIDWSD